MKRRATRNLSTAVGYPLSAKKSLGQHFLTSAPAIEHIVTAAALGPGDTVLEIGPGRGVLTKALLAKGCRVIAVEMDRDLIPVLEEMFRLELDAGQLRLIAGDIQEHLPATLGLQTRGFKVVANIPYYLTGLLFRLMLSGEVQPSCIVFLIQKEVAERITRSRKESLLSLSVKAYGTPRYVSTVKAGSFSPPPSVDSAILAIENISRSRFLDTESERRFFEVLKAGFAQKRKVLLRNLERFGKENVEAAFAEAGLLPNVRAEDVSLETWFVLLRNLRGEVNLE